MVSGGVDSPSTSLTTRSLVREITLAIIVVNSDDEAKHVAEQLATGASFAELAKKLSVDATADAGGFLGRLNVAGLRPEVQRALRGVNVGQITPVIRVPTGYAIL